LSIDPDVAETNQPYVFTNDDPLNASDPLGTLAVALNDGGVDPTKIRIGMNGNVTMTANSPTFLVATSDFGIWQLSASATISGEDATASCSFDYNATSGDMTATTSVDGVSQFFTAQLGADPTAGFGFNTSGGGSVSYSGGQVTISWPVTGGTASGTVSINISEFTNSHPSQGFSEAQVVTATAAVATMGVIAGVALARYFRTNNNDEELGGYDYVPGRLPA
jgi:hypothetical protein